MRGGIGCSERPGVRAAAVTLALGLVAALAGAARAEAPGNPAPAAGDVTFDLPCGQVIAFREVATDGVEAGADGDGAGGGAGGILRDRRLRLGSSDLENAFLDYLRTDHVDGHFRSGEGRYYLMGKYEVTRAQAAALRGECLDGEDAAMMPAGRLSWYDAVEITRLLTAHLLRERNDALRERLGTANVVARLPTEAEWEFAARGGIAVGASQFQAEHYPMPGGLIDTAWINDPASGSGGDPDWIGLRDPNPLGIHDLYGNLGEIILEPFRLNKAGRAHGLAGGFIAKGGDYNTSRRNISSSARIEHAHFDERGEERRAPTLGMRVVLAGPVLPNVSDVRALREEWNRAGAAPEAAGEDPLSILAELREGASDLTVLARLGVLEGSLRETFGAGSESRERMLRAMLDAAGRTVERLRATSGDLAARERLFGGGMEIGGTERAMLRGVIRRLERDVAGDCDFLHDLLVTMTGDFGAADLRAASLVVVGENEARDLPVRADATRLAARLALLLLRDRQDDDGTAPERELVCGYATGGSR